jgi:hypothetical protein
MDNNRLQAGDRSNARGLGMSTACVVSSFGIDAYGINPANYYYEYKNVRTDSDTKLRFHEKGKKPYIEISLASMGGGYGSDKSLDFYSNYLNYLSIKRETFANRFLNLDSVFRFRQYILPDEDTQVNYDFELKWFSVNYVRPGWGAVNFTISDKVGLNTNVLNKNESFPMPKIEFGNGTSYNIVGADLHLAEAIAWWLRKYSIGFSTGFEDDGIIKNIRVGFNASLVHGFGNVIIYNSGIKMNTYGISRDSIGNHIDSVTGKQNFYSLQSLTDLFQDYIDGAKTHFNFFPRPAGKGFCLDAGITLQIGNHLWFSASVTELGYVRWNYNTLINKDTNDFKYSDFYVLVQDPTYNEFVNDLDGLDTRYPGVPYTTDMPTKYRVGVLYKPSEALLLELDWQKGANNLPSNSTEHKVSAGTEYYLTKNVPLRAGFSFGGAESFNIALGAGLSYGILTVDISTYNLNKIWRQFIQNNRVSVSISGKLNL